MKKAQRLLRESCILFICDIQEKFVPRVYGKEGVMEAAELMVRSAKVLNIPIITTEQTRKVMGETIPVLKRHLKQGHDPIVEKTLFSMMVPEVIEILKKHPERDQVILIGAETQICILQTSLDLLERNYEVYLPVDAITSMRSWQRTVALKRLQKEGAVLTTFESAVFDLLKNANDPKFKEILAIIKQTKRQSAIPHL